MATDDDRPMVMQDKTEEVLSDEPVTEAREHHTSPSAENLRKRGRLATEVSSGAAIGAAVGLVAGASGPMSILSAGVVGAAVLGPLFPFLGAVVGAALGPVIVNAITKASD